MATAAHAVFTPGPGHPARFAERHSADAWFFPAFVGVIWVLMLACFGPGFVEQYFGEGRPYRLIVHIHAVVFFGWLAFLAWQVALVRTGNVRLHRRMGLAGMGLALLIPYLGPATALAAQRAGEAPQPPAFLALQFINVIVFGGCIAAALALRRHPAAHKRLMLIGTLALIGAGFGRIVRMVTGGPPPWTLIPSVYIAGNLLLLAMALYDYRTRGRLHPVFLAAAGGFVAAQLAAGQLLRSPAWGAFARDLVA